MTGLGDIVQFPDSALSYRVSITFGAGLTAAVDVKRKPSPTLISEVRERLEQLIPALVEHDAVLLQFGPESNIASSPTKGKAF